MSHVFGVTWYRFRRTLRRRVTGYLGIVLLLGIIGGLAMTSLEAGRRTQSSYATFLASTNPSDVTVSFSPPGANPTANGAKFTAAVSRIANVKHVKSIVGPEFFPLSRNGAPRLVAQQQLAILGSLDGMLTTQDRTTLVKGRRANPHQTNEIVMTASSARRLGMHVGSILPLGFYTPSQMNQSTFGSPAVVPRVFVRAKLVGIVELNSEVIQDDIDRSFGVVILTPALIRKAVALSPSAAIPVMYGLQLVHGDQDVPQVEKALIRLFPAGSTYEFHETSRVVSEVELSVKPESIALGAFGLIALLICLVLAIQSISRQLQREFEDRQIMRALGARPFDAIGDGLIGLLGAVVLGSLVAFIIAVALSPLSPIGPVRTVYPDRGIAFDWTVLGLGFAVLIVVPLVAAVALSSRSAPHRVKRRSPIIARNSMVTRSAKAAGGSVACVVGAHFALNPGQGRTAVPVRSALVGSVFAVALMVTTVTFASGLSTLISHPALYGWNWNYMLNPSNTVPPHSLAQLSDDPDVAAWSGATLANAQFDGQTIPILLTNPRAKVAPPILTGHGLDAKNQVVLGAASLALLHKKVGDTVTVTYGSPKDAPIYIPPTNLTIVGTATFPAVGFTSFIADHTSMGNGALVANGTETAAMQKAIKSPDPNLNGPEMAFVRLKPGVSDAAGRANLQKIAEGADKILADDPHAVGNTVKVLGVIRPAQIVNYHSIGSTPIILALGLAGGAIVALGLTLVASVRRRRRELALLKTLGFSQRQLAAAVAWQATIAAAIGIIFGIPIGIASGRALWTLFARNINAVPDPTVPLLSVVIIAASTLIFANLVALLPGRIAARTSTAMVLRAE